MKVHLAALALSLAPGVAAAQSVDGVVDLSTQRPGAVAVQLRSTGVPLQVVVERRVERPPAEARARGVVLGAGRCETPCTLWVPPGVLRLRAQGPGVRATDEDIDVPAGGAEVTVRAGRAALHNVGVGLVGAGATAILATMFVALADQGVFSGTTRGSLDLSTSAVIGAAAGGAALLAAGIPLLLAHRNGATVRAAAVSVAVGPGGVAATLRF